MRHALWRILGIMPTLLVVALSAFWLFSSVAERVAPSADSRATRFRHLPRFVNLDPLDVTRLALKAFESVATNDPDAEASARLLVRLGGAALPHVLPHLDRLPPDERARVALALRPVAERMGVATRLELDEPGEAVLFWTRFWQDRAIDYRPVGVRRLVRRLGERSLALRRDDIVELDTYALSELIGALPSNVATEEHVERVRRLSALAAHVSQKPWSLPAGASPEEARALAQRWRDFWSVHARDYTSFEGARRLLAVLTETQFGKWAMEMSRHRLGRVADGRTALDVMLAGAPVTLGLISSALLLGTLLGMAWGSVEAGSGRGWLQRMSEGIALFSLAVPAVVLGRWGSELEPGLMVALLISALSYAALASRHQLAASSSSRPSAAKGRFRAVRAWAVRSSPLMSLSGVALAELLTVTFVIERIFRLDGLGSATFQALRTGDVVWLMAVTLALAALAALLQILSDAALVWVRPAARFELAERGRA